MGNLLFLDTETTGFLTSDAFESPSQPWPVEISAIVTKPNGETIGSFEALIKPDGWRSQPGALKVHGISDEMAKTYGIDLATAISILDVYAENASTVLAYPARFDCQIIHCACVRLKLTNPLISKGVTCVQTMVRDHFGQNMKLLDAYEHLMKRPLKAAHCARVDAVACRDVYIALLREKERVSDA